MSLNAAFRRRKKVRYNMYARPYMLCDVHAKKHRGCCGRSCRGALLVHDSKGVLSRKCRTPLLSATKMLACCFIYQAYFDSAKYNIAVGSQAPHPSPRPESAFRTSHLCVAMRRGRGGGGGGGCLPCQQAGGKCAEGGRRSEGVEAREQPFMLLRLSPGSLLLLSLRRLALSATPFPPGNFVSNFPTISQCSVLVQPCWRGSSPLFD